MLPGRAFSLCKLSINQLGTDRIGRAPGPNPTRTFTVHPSNELVSFQNSYQREVPVRKSCRHVEHLVSS